MIDKLLTASANALHDWLENTSHRLLFASACFYTKLGHHKTSNFLPRRPCSALCLH